MISRRSVSIASDTLSTIRAWTSLARLTHAVPKYWTSTSRCTVSLSGQASHPMVMPHPPQGLLMVTAEMPRSYALAMGGSLRSSLCSRRRYTSSHRIVMPCSRQMSMTSSCNFRLMTTPPGLYGSFSTRNDVSGRIASRSSIGSTCHRSSARRRSSVTPPFPCAHRGLSTVDWYPGANTMECSPPEASASAAVWIAACPPGNTSICSAGTWSSYITRAMSRRRSMEPPLGT